MSSKKTLVRLTTWHPQFRRIDFIQLIRLRTAVDLGTAKRSMEAMLDVGELELSFVDENSARDFLKLAEAAGVNGEIVADPCRSPPTKPHDP